jgi:hypothetical protein
MVSLPVCGHAAEADERTKVVLPPLRSFLPSPEAKYPETRPDRFDLSTSTQFKGQCLIEVKKPDLQSPSIALQNCKTEKDNQIDPYEKTSMNLI